MRSALTEEMHARRLPPLHIPAHVLQIVTLLRASHVVLTREEDDASDEALASGFAEDGLVCCNLAGGAARMYSDFRLHPEGNGRLLIVDHGLTGIEPGQLLRRILELGNYRKMALLGLPV